MMIGRSCSRGGRKKSNVLRMTRGQENNFHLIQFSRVLKKDADARGIECKGTSCFKRGYCVALLNDQ